MPEVLKVLDAGFGISFQDAGRKGWRQYGMPPGGFMDAHAAGCANRLLDNGPRAAVLELLLQGARLESLAECWVAICGADCECNLALGRCVKVKAGDQIVFPHNQSGVWAYLAVEGGFLTEQYFGSASYYARGKVGFPVLAGAILRNAASNFTLAGGVAGRVLHWENHRDLLHPPAIRVWPGPQLAFFPKEDREAFFSEPWTVTPQSDRAGYRLQGTKLRPDPAEITSEPVLPGSIQVPENGQPIITMPDGPTAGGYPKIGIVDPADLSWAAQARPGQQIHFRLVDAL